MILKRAVGRGRCVRPFTLHQAMHKLDQSLQVQVRLFDARAQVIKSGGLAGYCVLQRREAFSDSGGHRVLDTVEV
ncbi:MAG: hypothetical protein JWN34_3184 [Bryobacterales bacterium]|nr:hypothetical protein [Bryobacterales bacterium]